MFKGVGKAFRRTAEFCLATFILFASHAVRAENDPRLYAVELTATIQSNPPQITLNWPADSNATGYSISRKSPDVSTWTALTNLVGSASKFSDANVAIGAAYEYRIAKTSTLGIPAFGCILAGIEAPLVENRGKIILLVDSTYADALATELTRLQQDLLGDGWTVIRRNVLRDASVNSVKGLIKAAYDADPANVKMVFLFGHIPVPRSGDIMADEHPNHQGAWAADTFYADMTGAWTDATVNDKSAERDDNFNVPGDDRFDQSEVPADLKLALGRVDLADMTCFANKTVPRAEVDLLRQYLNKDHNFRHALIDIPRRGLIADNFGEADGDAFAVDGWRNFAPMFGSPNIISVDWDQYFPTLSRDAYLWTYACGGGEYYTCAGVGGSDDFALNDVHAVFTMFFGSYFGDWDNESNFMRASLGSGNVLTTCWAGYPHWFFHRMALGEPIGYSARLSQNNGASGPYEQRNFGSRFVHTALLGDPTLRMHPVAPPSNLAATTGSQVTLSWTKSPDTSVLGYNVYRAPNANAPFTRLNTSLVQQASFADTAPIANPIYMVRAVKLERSPSGSYYNASQGAFYPATINFPPPASATAHFVAADTTTSGNWKSVYGADGNWVAGASANIPTYATVNALSPQWIWSASTTSRVAPYLPGDSTNRIAACWYSSTQLGFNILINDGQPYRIAAYFLDATSSGRIQRVDLLDLDTGALLDSRTLSNFSQGIYLIWEITGHVAIRVTPSNVNAVVSALFFDSVPPPVQSTARFISSDATTAGNWKNVYGSEGNWIAAINPNLPSYTNVVAHSPVWIWSNPASAPAPYVSSASTSRIASCWYSSSQLSFDITINDGKSHRLSMYFWDATASGRQQRIDVIDLATGAILDSRTLSNFSKGIYLTWQLTGTIGLRATPSTVNAVASALFFDPGASP